MHGAWLMQANKYRSQADKQTTLTATPRLSRLPWFCAQSGHRTWTQGVQRNHAQRNRVETLPPGATTPVLDTPSTLRHSAANACISSPGLHQASGKRECLRAGQMLRHWTAYSLRVQNNSGVGPSMQSCVFKPIEHRSRHCPTLLVTDSLSTGGYTV